VTRASGEPSIGSPVALAPCGTPAGTAASGARVADRLARKKMAAAAMTIAAAVPAIQSHGRVRRRGADGLPAGGEDGRVEDGPGVMPKGV
jgi:hypothetical protein